jgi:hypothetical protein
LGKQPLEQDTFMGSVLVYQVQPIWPFSHEIGIGYLAYQAKQRCLKTRRLVCLDRGS